MAGLRRSKRLESGNQPDQDKVTKIARVSKDQEKAVTGKNKKTGESAMEGPSGPCVDTASLENAPPKDASPNRASEQQPDEEFLPAVSKELQARVRLPMDKFKSPFKDKEEGFADFRRAIQTSIGLDDQQVYLYRKWKELGNQIQAVSRAAGFNDCSWDSLDEAAQQRFIGYSPHAQQLFEDSFSREHIFSRWIWEIVDENFFAGKSQDTEWNSPYWEAQATMERILREKNFDYDEKTRSIKYPNWRYTTIDLYYTLEGVSSFDLRIEPGCVVKILKKALGQYLPDNPGPWLKQMLSQLAETVAKFELWFDCGRETLRLVFDHPENKEPSGFPFSPRAKGFNARKVMERVDGFDAMYEGQLVDLVVSPILMGYGTPHGYDYDVRSVLFPMQVCVGYLGGCEQDEVVETEEEKIIKDKESGTNYEDEKKSEDEE
ncbi:uncharacterized protein LW93_5186 [Fusarium fujikuroi]|nr:uncharacterized protein LW93_5186 [Fusarium fujikuroi]SCV53913.1 uncharacterized protein FFB14_13376 [Fusarium fujikuroi]